MEVHAILRGSRSLLVGNSPPVPSDLVSPVVEVQSQVDGVLPVDVVDDASGRCLIAVGIAIERVVPIGIYLAWVRLPFVKRVS